MSAMEKKTRRNIILGIGIPLGVLALIGGSFGIYVATPYRADDTAKACLNQPNVNKEDRSYTINGNSTTCILFYPGARVEAISYLPLLTKISSRGYDCRLIEMPMNFAFTDKNAASRYLDGSYSKYVLMGHSLGAAMASYFADENKDKLDALIVLGSIRYKTYPLEKTLTVYGSLNDSVEKKLDYNTNVVRIEGGNHCYFGNYGQQNGDPVGQITREEQQTVTVNAIDSFLKATI